MVDINDTLFFLNREKEEQHAAERAAKYEVPYVNLAGYPIVKDVLDLIPEYIALKYKIIPYLKTGDDLKIGAVSPNDSEMLKYLDNLEGSQNINPNLVLISESSFHYGISCYEAVNVGIKSAEVEQKQKTKEYEEMKVNDLKSAAEAAKKASLTKLLDVLLLGAMKLDASDIHLEPSESELLVRYRIDGVLQDVVVLPLQYHKQLTSRIKYLSKLRMDIVSEPQDGRFSFSSPEERVDFRVSIMPSASGESIVLRLLRQEKAVLKLESLGFRMDALAAIRDAISKPHGMIITSGPTGSGKSSTLYAILMEVKKPGVKIITLEDPVEYKIEGIEQSQVRPGQGYEFADGLRASLRQDPDILMVGEIRDQETAEIAVQAALTGHLLLSTIHANSAPSVFARLLEIGVRPFLLSGSINLIMAQRLVRKICPYCQEQYSPTPSDWQTVIETLNKVKDKLSDNTIKAINQKEIGLVHGRGCEKCNGTGFAGRQVIVETLVPNEEISNLIAKGASISEFEKNAIESGMVTMEQDGLIKALSGLTTLEEVWRVTKS
jgi:type IV pilus assembly protein PilB